MIQRIDNFARMPHDEEENDEKGRRPPMTGFVIAIPVGMVLLGLAYLTFG